MIINKKVFNKVKFANRPLGEDTQFCDDCCKRGIRIYSTDKFNYVYIRHGDREKHTWNINDKLLLKLCKVIGKIDDYKNYVLNQKFNQK